jgi:hypothetical protein
MTDRGRCRISTAQCEKIGMACALVSGASQLTMAMVYFAEGDQRARVDVGWAVALAGADIFAGWRAFRKVP